LNPVVAMPVSHVLVFLLPLAAGMTQTQTDDWCTTPPRVCTKAEHQVCCGKTVKEYGIPNDTACVCTPTYYGLPPADIESNCAAALAIPDQPDCTAKLTECCSLSPKQNVASSVELGCCCAAADPSDSVSMCSVSGALGGGGGAAVGFGAVVALAFLLK